MACCQLSTISRCELPNALGHRGTVLVLIVMLLSGTNVALQGCFPMGLSAALPVRCNLHIFSPQNVVYVHLHVCMALMWLLRQNSHLQTSPGHLALDHKQNVPWAWDASHWEKAQHLLPSSLKLKRSKGLTPFFLPHLRVPEFHPTSLSHCISLATLGAVRLWWQ